MWFVIDLLDIHFALEKKQGCKTSNRLKGSMGKFRELKASKPEAFNE